MIYEQATLFLIFVFNGIVIGMIFDFFRILRKTFKQRNITVYIQDIIFWILSRIIYIIFFICV